MDIEQMIGSVISGALTGKRKRRRGAGRFLSGGRGSFLNASTLMALAGVAWGIYETATKQDPVSAAPAQTPPQPTAPAPPVPTATTAAPPVETRAIPDEVLRLLRLTISAARADGTLTPAEEATIVEHARTAGAEEIVQRELRSTFTLAQIVAGVTDPRQRDELYTIAFALIRADEQVTGGERIYLAQLAHQLGLDAPAAARLEQDAAAKIDAAAAQADDAAPQG